MKFKKKKFVIFNHFSFICKQIAIMYCVNILYCIVLYLDTMKMEIDGETTKKNDEYKENPPQKKTYLEFK